MPEITTRLNEGTMAIQDERDPMWPNQYIISATSKPQEDVPKRNSNVSNTSKPISRFAMYPAGGVACFRRVDPWEPDMSSVFRTSDSDFYRNIFFDRDPRQRRE